jgi:FdrA protein
MSRYVDVRTGAYHDSVSLMQVSRDAAERPDVTTALVAMATDLNLTMLADLGFDTPDKSSPNDLLVAVEAADDDAVAAAVATIDAALSRRPAPDGDAEGIDVPPARTVTAAARRVEATLALVSTPGRYAAIDAADALGCGLDVMVFSDNVSVRDEVLLKQMAVDRGLLVMGPDCGTAVVDGVGLGFANVVRPGPVGIVAASGTGAQHLLSLLDGAGIGVRHCLGVGGRDLSAEVAARSTLTALDRLAADETVDVLAVVSKPPAPEVAERVTAHAESLGKPVVLGYLGAGRPDLTATAASVADRLGVAWREPAVWGTTSRRAARKGDLRGLFCGGTLCDEAMLVAEPNIQDTGRRLTFS